MPESLIEIDVPSLRRQKNSIIKLVLAAGTEAIREQTRAVERDLEGITRVAVKGRLWRGWKSEAYPRKGAARKPEGVIWFNGGARSKGAIKFFTESGRVRQKDGGFFAIPTKDAGARGRKRDLTPAEWELRTGVKLRFVYNKGGASVLVADNVVKSRQRGGGAVLPQNAGGKPGARARKSGTKVIFTLIPVMEKQNRFSVRTVFSNREARIKAEFDRRVSAIPQIK